MKVKDLIEFLSELDPDLDVMVDGYESGCSSLERRSAKIICVQEDPNHEWWEGRYEKVEASDLKALLLGT